MTTFCNVMVRKLDNGFRGVIIESKEMPSLMSEPLIFNRQLKSLPRGATALVLLKVTESRRFVKDVKLMAHAGSDDEMVDSFFKEGSDLIHLPDAKIAWHFEPKSKEVVLPEQPIKKEKDAAMLDGYFISHDARLVFNTAYEMSKAKPERAVKVMMVGASGYGKTLLPRLVAQITKMDFMRMNCANIRDPEEWFGFREARDGSTVFIKSQFAKAIEAGNLVVVLDEFNRLEPWLHNTLFPLLDDDGRTVVHDEEFKIGPNVMVVGTINSGYKYTGTFELDEALMNRFDFVLEVSAMPTQEEVVVLVKRTGVEPKSAATIVKVANILRERDVVCSTRSTLLLASMVVAGMTIREAFEVVVTRRLPTDNGGSNVRKAVVDQINAELGPFKMRKLTNDIFSLSESSEEEPRLEIEEEGAYGVALRAAEGVIAAHYMIPLIKVLRQLPRKVEAFSLREAKNVAESIRDGEAVRVVLTKKVDLETLKELRRLGVNLEEKVF